MSTRHTGLESLPPGGARHRHSPLLGRWRLPAREHGDVPGGTRSRMATTNHHNEGVVLFCLLTLQTVCQPVLRRTAQERPVRTSLDLELDLQASLTRQSRLNDELQALRGLRQKLEALKAQGETDLPPGVLEDERFQKLLKQAEKQAEQSKEEQKQDLNAEKLMRQVSKDVCRLREQSRKVPRQVQSFREKIAYFTRAKISIPSLPADDV